MKKMPLFLFLLLSLLTLCRCAPYEQANQAITQTALDIQRAKQPPVQPQPIVVTKSGYYVSPKPIHPRSPTPKWLKRRVVLQAKDMPFSSLVDRLLRQTGKTATYDDSVKPMRLVSMNYSGSIQGALKALAAKTRYAYALSGDEVNWSAFVNKTFNISFMPGTSTYLVGRSKEGSDSSASSASFSGEGSAARGKSMLDEKQFSNLKGELSVWRDLTRTLNELKSPEGRVIVSESTTSVTVHDHPANVDAMKAYIDKLNATLSKEVSIKVQVLEVALNKAFNLGIDWDVLSKEIWDSTDLRITGSLGSAADLVATNVIRNSGASGTANVSVGKSFLRALTKQGRVRVVTKPEVVTMNDQIAAIRITQNTGYVQSVSSTVTGTAGNITTSITPGNVTDGLTLYILPKIQGNKVYMQISSVLSNLESLQNISVPNRSNADAFSAVEVPKVAEKSFNQRSVVTSGATLIIAGYKQLRDAVDNTKLFGVSALGGKGAESRNVETLVLITPTILRNN